MSTLRLQPTKGETKPTFCHPDIDSSLHLTEAPQHILHEVSKSCQGSTCRTKMRWLWHTACPCLSKHTHTYIQTGTRISAHSLCVQINSPGIILPPYTQGQRGRAGSIVPALWIARLSVCSVPSQGQSQNGAIGAVPSTSQQHTEQSGGPAVTLFVTASLHQNTNGPDPFHHC